MQWKQGTPTEEEILQLAQELVLSWKAVARALGLRDDEIHEIQEDNRSIFEQSYAMLVRWKQRQGSSATYEKLANGLKHNVVGRHDLATQYCTYDEGPGIDQFDPGTSGKTEPATSLNDATRDSHVESDTEQFPVPDVLSSDDDVTLVGSHEWRVVQCKQGTPTNEELLYLAQEIVMRWKPIGRALGLSDSVLCIVEADNHQILERSYAILMKWKQCNGSSATYKMLSKALERVQMPDLARRYCSFDKGPGNDQFDPRTSGETGPATSLNDATRDNDVESVSAAEQVPVQSSDVKLVGLVQPREHVPEFPREFFMKMKDPFKAKAPGKWSPLLEDRSDHRQALQFFTLLHPGKGNDGMERQPRLNREDVVGTSGQGQLPGAQQQASSSDVPDGNVQANSGSHAHTGAQQPAGSSDVPDGNIQADSGSHTHTGTRQPTGSSDVPDGNVQADSGSHAHTGTQQPAGSSDVSEGHAQADSGSHAHTGAQQAAGSSDVSEGHAQVEDGPNGLFLKNLDKFCSTVANATSELKNSFLSNPKPSAHRTNGSSSVPEIASAELNTTEAATSNFSQALDEGGQGIVPKGTLLNLCYKDYSDATKNFAKQQSLSQGGQGEVFKGKFGKIQFAVKKLERKRAYEREKKMIKCRHPFILRVWDICTNNCLDNSRSDYLVVYPLMKGNLYDAIVKDKRIRDYKKRIQIVLGCSCGLQYLHDQGIIHRDVKSANMLLNAKDNPRLGDFGLIKEIEPASDGASGGLTSSSLREGTDGYYCNIAINNPRKIKKEMDLHGLGVVMMELLTGMAGSDPEDKSALYYKMEIDEHLSKPEEAVEIIFANETLVERIHEAGWPVEKDNDAKKFAELAVRCVNRNAYADRIPLNKLYSELKELALGDSPSEAGQERKVSLYEDVGDSKCVFCSLHDRDLSVSLACDHQLTCRSCLLDKNNDSLFCPQCCSEQWSLVGNKYSYGICIAGGGNSETETNIFIKDVEDMAEVLRTRMSIPKENVVVLRPDAKDVKESTCTNIRSELKSIRKKVEAQRQQQQNNSEGEVIPTTVVVAISGHGKGGILTLNDGELSGNSFMKRLKDIEADNTIVFIDICNAEAFLYGNPEGPSCNDDVHDLPAELDHDPPPDLDHGLPAGLDHDSPAELDLDLPAGLDHDSPAELDHDLPAELNLFLTAHTVSSIQLFKTNLAVICSCGKNDFSMFTKGKSENSDFFKFVILALNGAERCYNDKTGSEVRRCLHCEVFRRRTESHGFVEFTDLTQYVYAHLKKAKLPQNKVRSSVDGRYLLLAKAPGNQIPSM